MTIIQNQGTASFFSPVSTPSNLDLVDGGRPADGQAVRERQAWQGLIDDCLRIRLLDDDYDGQGAQAPSPILVDSAIKLACQLRDGQRSPAHYATAGVNGTIHFEWVEPNHSLDVEVIAPGLAEVVEVYRDGHSPPIYFLTW